MAYLLTGWDVARLGAIAIKVTDSGGTVEFRYTAGTRAHRTLASVSAVSGYTDFATELQTDLNADATLAGTYTVSFAAATGVYTISATGGGNITLGFSTVTTAAEGTRMRQLLGMSGDRSGAATYDSQVTPYYYLALTKAGPAKYSRPFEVAGQTKRQVSTAGNAYSIRPRTREKRVKFELMFQTLATVHASDATASVPWTYEDLLGHVGAWEPVVLSYTAADIVFKYVDPEFSEEARASAFGDYHSGGWHLRVDGQYLGAL